jgi:hypothetical protein
MRQLELAFIQQINNQMLSKALTNSLSRHDQNLTAHASFEEGIEEIIVPILLKGTDKSGMNRDLFFQITSLPKNGVVIDPESERILEAGEILNQTDPYPWSGVEVHYKGNKNFFTNPRKWESSQNYETFEFAVMAPMQGEVAIGTSLPVSNNITIVNVNDPPVLNVPTALQSISMFSSLNWGSSCDANEIENCSDENRIKGITVHDPDKAFESVRVDLKSTFGILTLNQEHLRKAEFASCSQRNSTNSTWNCKGSGTGDQEVRYLKNVILSQSHLSKT